MANFQFSLYLRESGLSEAERANLERIFESLTPDRKLDIIERWPRYLDRILQIRQYAEAERKRNILQAFARIEAILDDAELRKQEAAERTEKAAAEQRAVEEGSRAYDAARRMDALKRIGRPVTATSEPPREPPPNDPLAQFL
jgi:hypothetical protein